jgi:hypothetical protein
MGVLFRRNREDRDQDTYSLINRGVYRIPDYYEDDEGKRFKGAKMAYSFWSAVRYTFFLSILLWWLPIFGQMIAGYVGGRRAGSPVKAIVAALIPVGVFFAITMAMEAGYIPTEIYGISLSPGAILGSIGSQIPLIEPFVNFSLMYLNSFLEAIQATTSLRFDSYIITVAFAYIGGILSEQTRREMDYISRTGGQKTTVVVGSNNTSPQEVAESNPPWSAQLLQPRRRGPGPMSFEEMTALNANGNMALGAGGTMPPSNNISIEDREQEIDPEYVKKAQARSRELAKQQRKMEKRVYGGKGGLPFVKKGTKKGLVKARQAEPAPMNEDVGQRTGDWEFI